MNPEIKDAIRKLKAQFPFPKYLDEEQAAAKNLANAVLRLVPRGARVLDFGCGPLDKTAVLQYLGYQCSGCDNLEDDWHRVPTNRQKIVEFATTTGIDFHITNNDIPFQGEIFDLVCATDVLEHFHHSPRAVLNQLVSLLKKEGLLMIVVPNAGNIRKRIDLLRGKTNLPRYESFFWNGDIWNGHIREYVKDDLVQLSQYMNLRVVVIESWHNILWKIPSVVRPFYKAVTKLFPGWRDTWLLVAKKPADWKPIPPASRERYKEAAQNPFLMEIETSA